MPQIFICTKNSNWQAGEAVYTNFDGKMLRTYHNGAEADKRHAAIGECFIVTPRGKKKPIVEKVTMPSTRGKRIAWALSFSNDTKHADSVADFLTRSDKLLYECSSISIQIADNNAYALMFARRKGSQKTTLKPVLAYVSDTISQQGLEKLMTDYRRHHPISCPEAFIRAL